VHSVCSAAVTDYFCINFCVKRLVGMVAHAELLALLLELGSYDRSVSLKLLL
jgi:hypothetical protein